MEYFFFLPIKRKADSGERGVGGMNTWERVFCRLLGSEQDVGGGGVSGMGFPIEIHGTGEDIQAGICSR